MILSWIPMQKHPPVWTIYLVWVKLQKETLIVIVHNVKRKMQISQCKMLCTYWNENPKISVNSEKKKNKQKKV